MTDLDLFLKFYKQIGIELKKDDDFDGPNILYRVGADGHDTEVNMSDLFNGYFGFYSDTEFTKDGKLLRQGFWG